MQLQISPEALNWFQNEITVAPGYGIRFFGKVYGKTQVHDGFSVGMSVAQAEEPMVTETVAGIPFFIEKYDDWFFQGYDLEVLYNEYFDEPEYSFTAHSK